MRRKLLIPLLTSIALTPTIAMVGCGDSQVELVLDKYIAGSAYNKIISTEKTFLKKDSIFKFQIDTEKWLGPKSVDSFDDGRLSFYYIDAQTEIKIEHACTFENDFEIVVDGSPLDKSYFIWGFDLDWINITSEGLEKILNGKNVEGYVHIAKLRCVSLDPCWMDLRGYPKI